MFQLNLLADAAATDDDDDDDDNDDDTMKIDDCDNKFIISLQNILHSLWLYIYVIT